MQCRLLVIQSISIDSSISIPCNLHRWSLTLYPGLRTQFVPSNKCCCMWESLRTRLSLLLYAGDTCWNTPDIPAGYWYVAVPSDSSVSTTMAFSTSVRTAFMAGTKLPPDDMVSYWSKVV